MYIPKKCWVVIADAASCRIFAYAPNELTLLQKVEHPENRLKDSDLASDRPGHYAVFSGSTRGSYEPELDPKEVQIYAFARDIARFLDSERLKEAYNEIVIVALPHMHGLLMQHFNKHVSSMIVHVVGKNAAHLNNHKILELLTTL